MMKARSPGDRRKRTGGDEKLLRDQRDANENLVLNALRSQEATDAAEAIVKALSERERQLLDTAEFREQLLGIVGHDLRNPLAAITMAAGMLLRNESLGESDVRLIVRIVNSAQRMHRLITQLLDFTRSRLGGGLKLALKRGDLGEICRNVIAEIELARTIQLRLDLKGDLSGMRDADRIAEALSNLLGNAADHARPGTTIVVSARGDADHVVAEVSNQGDPIPPELLPVLFEPFHKARADDKYGTHLGLGLYIANQIVLSHGGSLSARCAKGTTTFSVRLPRNPPA